MAIPDFQTVMLPLLQFTADGNEHASRETIKALANTFGLTETEWQKLLPSGRQSVFDNRVYWAVAHLKGARLMEAPRRGYFHITERGRQTLISGVERVDLRYLAQFPEWVQFRAGRRHDHSGNVSNGNVSVEQLDDTTQQTPVELLEYGYQRLRRELADELLDQVKARFC